jgi:hypothetical protein
MRNMHQGIGIQTAGANSRPTAGTGDLAREAEERELNALARGGSMLLGAADDEIKPVSDKTVH